MSKARHRWHTYAKNCIRDYPKLYNKWLELKSIPATPNYDAVGHGTSISNPTEQIALRVLPIDEQREFDAVRKALEETRKLKDGDDKIRLIRLYYWQRQKLTLKGAGIKVGISERTASRWHSEFVYLVAEKMGIFHKMA